jgi:hypothetical protein
MCLYPLYTTFLFLIWRNYFHTYYVHPSLHLIEESGLFKRREIIIICTKYLVTGYNMVDTI